MSNSIKAFPSHNRAFVAFSNRNYQLLESHISAASANITGVPRATIAVRLLNTAADHVSFHCHFCPSQSTDFLGGSFPVVVIALFRELNSLGHSWPAIDVERQQAVCEP